MPIDQVDILARALDMARKGNTFAAYAMPGHKSLSLITPQDSDTNVRIYPWMSAQGFSINGARSGQSDVSPLSASTSKEEYITGFAHLIARLKTRSEELCQPVKTVYSRIECGRLSAMEAVVRRVFNGPTNHLRCMFNHPDLGCWIMSTPEVLLSATDGKFHTMALAGTRSATLGDVAWDAKNIEEQEIVAHEIVERLNSEGLKASRSQPYTRQSGAIAHICTDIYGELHAKSPESLAQLLSPTPALGGYPHSAAIEDIAQLERHDRRCYGGYIEISRGGSYEAFVVIRCAQVNPRDGSYCQYAGGGITPLSDPEDEWTETQSKLLIKDAD